MSVRPEIEGVLEDQNRWWYDANHRKLPGFYHRRDAFDGLWRLLAGAGERATVLVGPRQVGKTTLLLQVADRLLDEGWPIEYAR
jgi:predicted AAA+ superfamily ATPase